MSHEFSADDVSKPVLTSDDEAVGEIDDVVDGEAHLSADTDAPDEVRQGLGVDEKGTAVLESHRVVGVTDDGVKLNEF
ncbi:hypothetical protein ACFQE1_13465 [Halobium palmae]|uniref:PRC-barrel domain containing protein n=1 Tax=Halobium palmae TaxID=1776492 RepID=A0ABD5S1G7_9EURY